jgi:hypothetical protein
MMLALERKATVLSENNIRVKAQPFGGAVRILDPRPLQQIIGKIHFDSQQSEHEQDFRILIPSPKWEMVKHYCLRHLQDPTDRELESLPHRELMEEFEETLGVILQSDQYKIQALGTVVENNPTQKARLQGIPTVRVYQIFEARIVDETLCKTMLAASQQYSDHGLGVLAWKDFQNGGDGRANSILTVPLNMITEAYRALSPDWRYRKMVIDNYELGESVLAILEEVEVPQYQRLKIQND